MNRGTAMCSPKRDPQKKAWTVCSEPPMTDSCGQTDAKGDPVRTSVQSPRPQVHAPCPRYRCAKRLGRALSAERLSPRPAPLSLADLPRLVAQVGPDVALGESLWLEGPRLMASTLGVNIPVHTLKVQPEEQTAQRPAVTAVPSDGPADVNTTRAKFKLRTQPLTGMQVLDILSTRGHCGMLQFVHLNVVESNSYRPYDLRVVPPSQAGMEHYVFSRTSVLHVRDGCSMGVSTLREWGREAALWGALQSIPFFRDYLLRKAFSRWRRNVRRIILQGRCSELQGQLLPAVPQFRDALLQITRLIEELKQVRWLPQCDSQTYTLQEFHEDLLRRNEQSRGLLAKFLWYRALVLSAVQDECYEIHQELQHQVDGGYVSQRSQPMHLQLSQLRSLRGELRRAERTLLLLGNLATLVDHMIVQNLVTIISGEVSSFTRSIMKGEQARQGGLFQAELVFEASGQLTLSPPMHLLQDVLQGAVLSVADSALKVFDACSSSPEPKDYMTVRTSSSDAPRGLLTSNPNMDNSAGFPDSQGSEEGHTLLKINSFPQRTERRPPSVSRVILPKLNSLQVEGKRLTGQYDPLSQEPLQWQLSLETGPQEAERDLALITQETMVEIQQLCEGCSWLVEVHAFTCQWSPTCLEAMRGWPSQHYSEQIEKVRVWKLKLLALPASHTTSNKLLTVRCSRLLETTVCVLGSVEEDMLGLLVSELKGRSESLTSELRKAISALGADPQDLCGFTHFFSMTRSCERAADDFQSQLLYLRSLQQTLHMHFRPLVGEEVQLEKQLLDLWNHFTQLLKQAAEMVHARLPSMVDGLDSTFSSLVQDLEALVSMATSGAYLDPSQKPSLMVSQLKSACSHFSAVSTQLEELSRSSRILRRKTLDLSFVEKAKLKLESRKELWKLLNVSSAQIQEWKLLLFKKFTVHRAQDRVSEWVKKTLVLARTIPSSDAVLRSTEQLLEGFRQQVSLLSMLSSSSLKPKHWRSILKGVDLLFVPEKNLTVADVSSPKVLGYQDKICKIYQEAMAEASMEQVFRKLQHDWEGMLFCTGPLQEFGRQNIAPAGQSGHYNSHMPHSYDNSTVAITGLEDLRTQTEDSVMTLSIMLLSPYVSEFKQEVERLLQLLWELEELLDLWERHQQKWVFLNMMLHTRGIGSQKPELVQRFSPVDDLYRETIRNTEADPHVLSVVRPPCAETQGPTHRPCLHAVLSKGLSVMEEISSQLLYLLESLRSEFPRLCFLSDEEAVEVLSLDPTPSALLPVVRKCFHGVCQLKVGGSNNGFQGEANGRGANCVPSDEELWVWGVTGGLGEQVSFTQPLEPNLDAVAWLGLLEQQLKGAIVRLAWKCAAVRKSAEPLALEKAGYFLSHDRQVKGEKVETDELRALQDLLLRFPLQCVLVAEEAVWCEGVEEAFSNRPLNNLPGLRAHYTAKLQVLCRVIWDGFPGCSERIHSSCCKMSALRALILLTVKHSNQIARLVNLKTDLDSSFEWHKLLKYHFNYGDLMSQSSSATVNADNYSKEQHCFVDVLGSRFPYGYEYLGSSDWMMVSTLSTDRASLGILLALNSFKCSLVTGPSMSGKNRTVTHLGHALGRQVITSHCCRETNSEVIQKMLSGALQTGAWLVLDGVDLLSQGILSMLGQHLSDINVSLSAMQRCSQRRLSSPCNKGKHVTTDTGGPGACFSDSWRKCSELCCSGSVLLVGKAVLPKLGYGCIMVSSTLSMSELPENLRAVSRPISLVRPDYRIIAEVSLTALGFTDSLTMSGRVVSLFSLAKDSRCLPEFLNDHRASWLVVLKNVIGVAGMYLQHARGAWKNYLVQEDPELTPPETSGRQGSTPSHHKRASQSSVVMHTIAEEQAVIKGVTAVLLSTFSDPNKASQFCTIFKEVFPGACSLPFFPHCMEEDELPIVRAAVTEELQVTGLHTDPTVLCNALSLYEALKHHQAVLLVGQPGSRKTTCYRALAGATRRLAANGEVGLFNEGSGTNMRHSSSRWTSVNTVIIFPNSLSYQELWGGLCASSRLWRDGVVTRVLRDLERQDFHNGTSSENSEHSVMQNVKWLVLDGEPVGQPGWLDPLTTLSNPEDPFLCLPTGEKMRPSQTRVKILVEVTSLKDVAPSAIVHCGQVYHSGKDVWRAVWKAELEALYREDSLDLGTLSMWTKLSEDLFARTIDFLRDHALTPAMSEDGAAKPRKAVVQGLQEVMSFFRILKAFLVHFGKDTALTIMARTTDKTVLTEGGESGTQEPFTETTHSQFELQMRNMFVVAYIWGFGGHLHPRHWPQYDAFIHEALYRSRYSVEVPAEGTVFHHFISINERLRWDSSTGSKSPQIPYTIIPQYEMYAYLLDKMLEAKQPVLLVGEAGSGKTALCQSLLSQKCLQLRLPASPLLKAAQLRRVLEHIGCQRAELGTQKAGWLLFVDDIHCAPCDVSGRTSTALETLRQCMSQSGVPTSYRHNFKSLSSGAVGYLATCSLAENSSLICGGVTSRLSRLFSIFVLPHLAEDTLFSMHYHRLHTWLNKFQTVHQWANLAGCIISSTFELYCAVRRKFPPSLERPHFLFSPCDLQKIFQGMRLWGPQSSSEHQTIRKDSCCFSVSESPSVLYPLTSTTYGPVAHVLSIACLWMHECTRTFGDRLCSEEENKALMLLLAEVSERTFGDLVQSPPHKTYSESCTTNPSPHPNSPYLKCRNGKGEERTCLQDESTSEMRNENVEVAKLEGPLDEVNNSNIGLCEDELSSTNDIISEIWDNSLFKGQVGETVADATSKDLEAEESQPVLRSVETPSALCCSSTEERNSRDKPEWKGSTKLAGAIPQKTKVGTVPGTEQSPGLSFVPLDVLQGMQASVRDAVFSPEFLSPLSSRNQPRTFQHSSRYREQDLDLLMQQLVSILKDNPMKEPDSHGYALYRQRVRQLAHIFRVLLISGGHGAMFATAKGTGRKATVRLATHLMGYQLLEVHSGNETTLPEILTEAGTQARSQGGNVVLLVHEDISQDARDTILLVMANGTFPGLYSSEDLIAFTQKVNAKIKNSHKWPRNVQGLGKSFQQLRQNIHVFLLMAVGSVRTRGQAGEPKWESITRALKLCCLVEVYQPWTTQSLTEVAAQHLKDGLQTADQDLEADKTCLMTAVPQALAGIHQSALGYASTLLDHSHLFGPRTYRDLMECFMYMCRHLYGQCRREAHRMATVLSRVRDVTVTAEQYSQDVSALRTSLAEAEQHHAQLWHEAEEMRARCSHAHRSSLMEQKHLAHLQQQAREVQQQAQDAFQQVKPVYQSALAAVQSLSQSDVNEVRHYRRPPEGVIAVTEAICLLFDCPHNWESCKQLLGQPNFFQELESYDHSRVTDEMFEALERMVQLPGFQPEAVRDVSRAGESLCRWVHAMHQHTSVRQHVAPLQERGARLEAQAMESHARLRSLTLLEEAAKRQLQDAEDRLGDDQRRLEGLTVLLREAEILERHATAVVQQVAQNVTEWNTAAQKIMLDSTTLRGDALILAAAVTYLGPFAPAVRSELLEEWHELCQCGRTDPTPEDRRRKVAGASDAPLTEPVPFTPISITNDVPELLCRAMGVSQDTAQTIDALLLKLILWGNRGVFTQRCPLLVNAQQHVIRTAKKQGLPKVTDGTRVKTSEYSIVVSADDPAVLEKITQSADRGELVLVTHLERAHLRPELLALLVHPARSHTSLCAHLALSTPLAMQTLMLELRPSILAEVRVIDVSLSLAEVRDIALMEMLQSQCPQLWARQCRVETDRQVLLGQLHQEESFLTDYILASSTPLLDDPDFLPRVSACQNSRSRMQAQLVELTEEAEHHRATLAPFRRLAELVTALYRALQEVAHLCPLYHFPLCGFLEVLRGALALRGRSDLSTGGQAETGARATEIALLIARLVMECYHARLFQGHTSLLRLLVSMALGQHNEDFSEEERVAFLQGLEPEPEPSAGAERDVPPPSLAPGLPPWALPHIQANVLRLERLPAFRGLASSLQARPEQWAEYLRFPSSTVLGPVPCSSHAHLSSLQRALLWVTLLPHSLSVVADDLAACQLGLAGHDTLTGTVYPRDSEGLSRLTGNTKGPVILILPGEEEPGQAQVYPLSWLGQAAQDQNDKKGVKMQVVTFGGKLQKEAVLKVLDEAVHEGHWLVFNNCHLLDQWDKDVLCQLTQLVSTIVQDDTTDTELMEGIRTGRACEGRQIHPCFRLWFITQAHDTLSIPAAVRVYGTHLACSSSWNLKEVLSDSLPQAMCAAATAPVHTSEISSEPLLHCAILHSVLLNRQAYGHLGQGRIYSWSQEDLQALLEAQVRVGSCCSDSSGAPEYIAADLVYGGHIEDAGDQETVEGAARACLRAQNRDWGRSPHILSDLVRNTGRFGSAGRLKELERRVQDLTHSSDPELVGFGAGLAVELVMEQSHSLGLLLRRLSTPRRAHTGPSTLPDLQHARQRLQALKDALDQRGSHGTLETNDLVQHPLQNFLRQEWDDLVDLVSSLLASLTDPLQTMKRSPATGLMCLHRLERRAELLMAYLWDRSPHTYHLSAFLNPRGFLAALVREAARAEQRDTSHVTLRFQVLSAGVLPASPPPSGAYLCGLELQGAMWDSQLGALQDTVSPQPCPLPVLWVTAQGRAPKAPPPSVPSSHPLYLCPLYVEGEDLAERNVITRVALATTLHPALCVLRRARLVSTLLT